MEEPSSHPGQPRGNAPRYSGRQLLDSMLWGLRLIWPINRRLTSLRIAMTALIGVLPAAREHGRSGSGSSAV